MATTLLCLGIYEMSLCLSVLTWGKGQAGKAGYSLKGSFLWEAERASQLPAENSSVPAYFTLQDQLWAPNAFFSDSSHSS